MKNPSKRITALVLLLTLSLGIFINVEAHERPDHDAELEYVLFGDKYYKSSHPLVKDKIDAIEAAAYLCIDQFNNSGTNELRKLSEMDIPDLPKSIDEFKFSGNYSHRNNTHRGWNMTYSKESHWDIRQRILRNTVNELLFSNLKTSWFSKKSDKENHKKQCEAFCVLVYNVHIIGDHIEAENYKGLAYIAPLSNSKDRDNPGIIPDIIKYAPDVFESQNKSRVYKAFISDLEELQDRSEELYYSKGGVDTDEEFAEYHKCAEDLLDKLSEYVPTLLKKEEFFKKAFYN